MKTKSQPYYQLLFTLLFLLFVLIASSCRGPKGFTLKASFDKEVASETIHALKTEPLLIVLPTESKKIRLLRNANPKEAAKMKFHLDILNKYIIDAFTTEFDYTEVLFIPDSLVHDYENGIEQPYFVNRDLNFDESVGHIFELPVKLILYDYRAFEVVQGSSLIPNPFPNRFSMGTYTQHWSFLGKFLYGTLNTWENINLGGTAQRINKTFNKFSEITNDASYMEIRKDMIK